MGEVILVYAIWAFSWKKMVIGSPSGIWAWWAKLDMDSNVSPGIDALLELKLDQVVQCYTLLVNDIIAQQKVSQP